VNPRVISLKAAPVVLLTGLLAGCAGSPAQSGPASGDSGYVAGDGSIKLISTGARTGAPKVTGTTINGAPYSLAKGKVTVINFWASWCAPCRGEAPTLQKIYADNQAKGVQFLGIDSKDGKDNALAFERSFNVTYPSIFDQAGQVALDFRDVPPDAFPSTLVLDREGRIAARIIGAVHYTTFSPLVAKLMAEK
jgi:thiol-disulfide isomerase/thioredoxin